MLDQITQYYDAVEHFLTTASMTRAILGGVIAAVAGTQWFKRWLWPALAIPVSKAVERLLLVSVAFAIGFFVTDGLGGGFYLALIVGFANPFLYTLATKIIYHRWPWLENKLSANPRKIVKTPQGYEERDITVPSGKDEHTVLYRKPGEKDA